MSNRHTRFAYGAEHAVPLSGRTLPACLHVYAPRPPIALASAWRAFRDLLAIVGALALGVALMACLTVH